MFSRTNLTSAEMYRTAMDQASLTVPRYNSTIRLNHMMADPDLAQQLARVGKPLTRAHLPEGVVAHDDDLLIDYVSTGAWFSFRVLREIIDPSNRVFGPGNFRVVPCDAGGKAIPTDGNSVGEPLTMPRHRLGYPLGEQREDYYHGVAVGMATGLAQGSGTKTSASAIQKAVETAARQNCDPMAYGALATAAVHANAIIEANQARILKPHRSLGNIVMSVLVEPVPGHELPVGTSYNGLITLDI